MKHCMFDVETLGTEPGCVVLSIGAVLFDETNAKIASFYVNIDREDSMRLGLFEDPQTLRWWSEQKPEAWKAPQQNPRKVVDALNLFRQFCIKYPADAFWAHKSFFDEPILSAVYAAAKMQPPWKHWQVFCSRTLSALTGIHPNRNAGTHHNALDDAINQAQAAMGAMAWLRMNGIEWNSEAPK